MHSRANFIFIFLYVSDKNFNPALGQAEKLRWRKDQTHWKQNIETPTER